MLVCKNCGSANPDGSARCVKCRMVGNLTPIGENNLGKSQPEASNAMVVCKNCGSETPIDSMNCGHCKFPQRQQSLENKIIEYKPTLKVLRNLG